MTPAKIYPFSIPAGGSFPLLVLGDYCKILTSSGPLTLNGDSFGSLGPILAGQGVEDTPFMRLVLEDNSGAANNGTVLIADNKFIDDRITGEVSVIDGNKSRTMSNRAFIGSAYRAGLASNYAFAQFYNEGINNVNVFIRSLTVSSSSAAVIPIGFDSEYYTTPVNRPKSKKHAVITSADTSANTKHATAVPGTFSELMVLYVPANQTQTFTFGEPLMVRPGIAFSAYNATLAGDLRVNMEFFEEVIL